MTKRYFSEFPLIEYNGQAAINILKRVDFDDNVKKFFSAFQPYVMQDGERLEHLAFNYYGDPDLDWLLCHSNEIMDPYYDAPLSEIDFDKFIVKKYGTIANAQTIIVHWKNNWESDDQVISTSAYNALLACQKKYWQPELGYSEAIMGYSRAQTEIIVSTNKILSAALTTATDDFVKGERVTANTSTYATVDWANTSQIVFKDVYGDFESNTNFSLTGGTSGETATVNAESVTIIYTGIPADVATYYSSVSAYDYLQDLNEKKRNLRVIDKKYVEDIYRQLKETLS